MDIETIPTFHIKYRCSHVMMVMPSHKHKKNREKNYVTMKSPHQNKTHFPTEYKSTPFSFP